MESYRQWLEAREQHRQLLFGESVDIAPTLGCVATAPLSVLAFNSHYSGRPSSIERIAYSEIEEATHSILEYHNMLAEENGKAIFGMGSREDLSYVAQVTAEVIYRWERACRAQDRKSPFADLVTTDIIDADFEREDVQLVVETASAVTEVIGLGYVATRDTESQYHKHLIRLIARRGPVFATAWIRGDIVRDYCERQGIEPDSVLSELTPKSLAAFAISNPRDPLRAALRYAEHLNTALSYDSLAEELGWSTERVATTFTRDMRQSIAKGWPDNPLMAAKRVAQHIDSTLATKNLAHFLGESTDYVNMLFRPSTRVRLALTHDPKARAKRISDNFKTLATENIAAALGWSGAEVGELFTDGYRRILATRDDPATSVRQIADTYKNTLSISNIARQLEWNEEQVGEVFAVAVRRRIAMDSPGEAMRKVKSIANTRNELLQNYQLPINVINLISAGYSRKEAFACCDIVQAELATVPPGTSPVVWMWSVVAKPKANRNVWLRSAAAYNNFIRVTKPSSLDGPIMEGLTLGDYIKDPNSDFTDGILTEEPGVYLQDLAVKAGVTYEELCRIMLSFTDDAPELSTRDQAIVDRLRKAST